MVAKILDGKKLSAEIKTKVAAEIKRLEPQAGRPPGLAVVLVGGDPASAVYVRSKRRTCDDLGIYSPEFTYDIGISQDRLLRTVEELNKDPRVDGILVQSPLPEGLNEFEVTVTIDPDKDVDGFHPMNVGRLLVGKETFAACTPLGVQALLLRNGIEISGANVVILGRSNIVGKPLAAILMQKKAGANATVTVCHSRTKDLPDVTRTADILVAAIGSPEFVKADMVAEGAVVVDVGINRVEDASRKRGYRLVGDVEYEKVSEKASWISPVPGGVGPMTIAMLMQNTLLSYKRRNNLT